MDHEKSLTKQLGYEFNIYLKVVNGYALMTYVNMDVLDYEICVSLSEFRLNICNMSDQII